MSTEINGGSSIPTKKDIEKEMKATKEFIQEALEKSTFVELRAIKNIICTFETLKFAYN